MCVGSCASGDPMNVCKSNELLAPNHSQGKYVALQLMNALRSSLASSLQSQIIFFEYFILPF